MDHVLGVLADGLRKEVYMIHEQVLEGHMLLERQTGSPSTCPAQLVRFELSSQPLRWLAPFLAFDQWNC